MGDFDYAMDVAFEYRDELSRTPRAGGNVRRGPLEYMPGERRLLVGAGVGWEPGTIGNISLGIDMESPAGYAFPYRANRDFQPPPGRNAIPHTDVVGGSRRKTRNQRSHRQEVTSSSVFSKSIVPTSDNSISRMPIFLPASRETWASL